MDACAFIERFDNSERAKKKCILLDALFYRLSYYFFKIKTCGPGIDRWRPDDVVV
jgi:hypothetical protein